MSVEVKLNPQRKQCYRNNGFWGDATLLDYWNMSVKSVPEKTAVSDSHGGCYTYKKLDEDAAHVASFLHKEGIKSGDFISFQLPGWAEFTVVLIACLKVGAVANPILPNFRSTELKYILNQCESKILFLPHEFRCHNCSGIGSELLDHVPTLRKVIIVDKYNNNEKDVTLSQIIKTNQPLPPTQLSHADDVAAVLFTSGTEGKLKGVMLTHNNIIASEKAFNATFNLSFLDVMLMPAPVAHATGFLHGVIAPFMVGAKSVLDDIFKAEKTLSLIEKEQCTISMGATPFLLDLLAEQAHSPKDISSLKFFLCGGAPIPVKAIEDAAHLGIKVIAVYGSTESAPHTATRPYDLEKKAYYTDGKALPGIEVKIVDCQSQEVPFGIQGEEVSRGPNVFVGYLKEPELTSKVLDEDGWYYSGDLCTCDQDGYIRVTGRKKDIIIRGGENISSKEVEDILLSQPNIKEAAVVAMPDAKFGERACAYIVLKNSDITITLQNIIDHFESEKVAKYKFPERIEVVKSLPKTASGKVKKYLLREDIAEKINM